MIGSLLTIFLILFFSYVIGCIVHEEYHVHNSVGQLNEVAYIGRKYTEPSGWGGWTDTTGGFRNDSENVAYILTFTVWALLSLTLFYVIFWWKI